MDRNYAPAFPGLVSINGLHADHKRSMADTPIPWITVSRSGSPQNPPRKAADGRSRPGQDAPESGERLICSIHDYAWSRYGKIIEDVRDRCPYDLDLDNDVYVRRQLVTWFASKWINPDTGATVVDEFVGDHVRDRKAASRILGLKDLIHDEFRMVRRENRFTVVRAGRDGALYRVMMTGDSHIILDDRLWFERIPQSHQRFEGQIFPWYPAGSYRTCGVVVRPKRYRNRTDGYAYSSHVEDRDHMSLIRAAQGAESVPVTSRLRLRRALKKFPTEWVYQMYLALGLPESDATRGKKADAISSALLGASSLSGILAGLSREERECLAVVVEANGYAEYSEMQRRFGPDDTEVRWSKSRPRSAISGLRRRGLLLVGLRRGQDPRRRVLAVPPDVLANLRRLRFAGMADARGM